jgi:hypothetical protein
MLHRFRTSLTILLILVAAGTARPRVHHAELQETIEGVQVMSDADKIRLVTDPDCLKRMTCASQCGVAYGQCAQK